MIKSFLSSMAHITSDSAGYQLKDGWEIVVGGSQ